MFRLIAALAICIAAQPSVIRHVTVYKVPGRFGGWPANHGIWSWGDEILAGFSAAYFQVKSPDRHQYVKLRYDDADKGSSWLWYSNNRGHDWRGPFRVPDFGQPSVAARTDYIVNGKHDAVLFLTAAKQNGKEGRVFCARTTDGGLHWKFVSWIGEEPAGFSIMPSSVRISASEIVTATRIKEDQNTSRIDGRLAITYGVRTAPFRICARLSSDRGRTWCGEIVLRSDAAAWDNGYTRSVQRPDGKIVTVYYFPEQPQTERIIAATIWDPESK